MNLIGARVLAAFKITIDYFDFIPEHSLGFRIPGAPANRIGDQVWCIIGARESYINAIRHGKWTRFSCSLHNPLDKESVLHLLTETANELSKLLLTTKFSSTQADYLLDLLEHELQHHGQLIRYSYANKLGFPDSWTKKYTVV